MNIKKVISLILLGKLIKMTEIQIGKSNRRTLSMFKTTSHQLSSLVIKEICACATIAHANL